MIAGLRGNILIKKPPVLVLDVAGVGYELEMPLSDFFDLPEIGGELMVHTRMVVREDAMLLYGFIHPGDKQMFNTLVKINGVGAKMALAILSGLSADELAHAVQSGDVAALTRLPGIGKKTAERLIVELKDRVSAAEGGVPVRTSSSAAATDPKQEAIAALMSLGFKPQEAGKRVNGVAREGVAVEEIIRLALKG
jgi:holliday junction DNA helicase RuvA